MSETDTRHEAAATLMATLPIIPALTHAAGRVITIKEFRESRLNHAYAEAAYSVPQRPVDPTKMVVSDDE